MAEEKETQKIQLEPLWKIYESINGWIRFSDTKAVAILGINGVIASFIFSNLSSIKLILEVYNFLVILLMVGIVSFGLSIYFSFQCLSPTLKVDESTSNIYFGNIAENYEDSGTYRKTLRKTILSEEGFFNELTSQIWVNSNIANIKYFNVQWCTRFFIFTVSIIVFSIFILLVKWMG